jgi:hypothetical protein
MKSVECIPAAEQKISDVLLNALPRSSPHRRFSTSHNRTEPQCIQRAAVQLPEALFVLG